ncbi:MAG TPA: hypothetical protein VF826_14220 [Chloroflexia bacterium]
MPSAEKSASKLPQPFSELVANVNDWLESYGVKVILQSRTPEPQIVTSSSTEFADGVHVTISALAKVLEPPDGTSEASVI